MPKPQLKNPYEKNPGLISRARLQGKTERLRLANQLRSLTPRDMWPAIDQWSHIATLEELDGAVHAAMLGEPFSITIDPA